MSRAINEWYFWSFRILTGSMFIALSLSTFVITLMGLFPPGGYRGNHMEGMVVILSVTGMTVALYLIGWLVIPRGKVLVIEPFVHVLIVLIASIAISAGMSALPMNIIITCLLLFLMPPLAMVIFFNVWLTYYAFAPGKRKRHYDSANSQ